MDDESLIGCWPFGDGQWHDDIITWKSFPYYWPFVRGIHRSPVDSPHKGSVMPAELCFDCFRHGKLLNKYSICWWFEMTWHSRDITVMDWIVGIWWWPLETVLIRFQWDCSFKIYNHSLKGFHYVITVISHECKVISNHWQLIVCSLACSCSQHRKHQGLHITGPLWMNSLVTMTQRFPHKGPVMQKAVSMSCRHHAINYPHIGLMSLHQHWWIISHI